MVNWNARMQGWFNIYKSICMINHFNKMEVIKNHMIILADAEKPFDKTQCPFVIKTLNKVGIEETYLNIIKVICNRPTTNIVSSESFSFKIRNNTRMPTLDNFIQHCIGNPSHSNQTRKRNKIHPDWKRRNKIVTIGL